MSVSKAALEAKIDEKEVKENELEDSEETDEVVGSAGEEAAEVDDGSKLPFPRATITNLVRKDIAKGKQLKGTVKDEMNIWVAELVERIAKKMNSQPYTFVNYEMLKDVIAPYEQIQDLTKQREDLIKMISSIKNQCNQVIDKIDSESRNKAISLKLDSEDLPFPKATITNKLRKYLSEGKTIKGPVKKGLNVWLGSVVSRVSKRMDSYPYPYIDRSMFKEAIEPYETISEIELEKERIIQEMESIKTACKILEMEVERKFKM
ncbi:MAG: hypothetical protein AABW59_04370 [archaeon]